MGKGNGRDAGEENGLHAGRGVMGKRSGRSGRSSGRHARSRKWLGSRRRIVGKRSWSRSSRGGRCSRCSGSCGSCIGGRRPRRRRGVRRRNMKTVGNGTLLPSGTSCGSRRSKAEAIGTATFGRSTALHLMIRTFIVILLIVTAVLVQYSRGLKALVHACPRAVIFSYHHETLRARRALFQEGTLVQDVHGKATKEVVP